VLRRNRGTHDRVLATATAEARRRFGGTDVPAASAGALAAIGFTVVIGAVAAGIMAIAHDRGSSTDDLSYAGFVTGLALLVVGALVGGWVAARLARYDGGRNAALSAILFALLAGATTAVAAWLHRSHDLASGVTFPDWLEHPSTLGVITVAAATLVVGLITAELGGALGSRYHRRADAVVATPPPGVVNGEADVNLARSEHAGRQAVL